MDDFIMLVNNKAEASILYDKIKVFLNKELNLDLNKKSRYFPGKLGIDFCGYHIYETHILLRKRFKKKIIKTLKIWECLKKKNRLSEKKQQLSGNSLKSHMNHANTFYYKQKLNNILQKGNINYIFK